MQIRFALAFAIGMAACRSDEPPAVVPPVITSVCVGGPAVSPIFITLHIGETAHFTTSEACYVKPSDWRWSASDTTIIYVDSLSGDARALKPGNASVVVHAAQDPANKASGAVLVLP